MKNPNNSLIEQVFSEYRERIYGYIATKNIPFSERDDVFSEIMLKATQQAQRYDSARASVSTWVYIITRCVVADYFRRTKPELPLSESLAVSFNMEAAIELQEQLKQLANGLERLPQRERQVIILRLYNDKSYREIALDMNISEANSRKIYSRAIERLKASYVSL